MAARVAEKALKCLVVAVFAGIIAFIIQLLLNNMVMAILHRIASAISQ
jgi:hypothetical protein